ncbi:hypothetical protein F5884DRAFT_747615 [Xylogone sp. PMI_703]|nr:hypothetical protein F5884DRAFT_747615 [Xylogone sp. PMI_703]
MATGLESYGDCSIFINSHFADQSHYGRVLSNDGLFGEMNTKFANIQFGIANDVQQVLKLFHDNGDSVPRALCQTGTHCITGLIPEDLLGDLSKTLTSASANNGSICSYGKSNKIPSDSSTCATDKQIVRWANSYERHESIAYRYPCSKPQQNQFSAEIKLHGQELNRAVSEWKATGASGNTGLPSVDSIADAHRAFGAILKSILRNDPSLASNILSHLAPKLHLICPLFKGKGLMSLLEEDITNQGEQDADSQQASSSISTYGRGSSWALKNNGGSSKAVRKREQDDEDDNDNGKGSKRNKRGSPSPSLQKDPWRRPRFMCHFYARCSINNCKKNGNGRTSTSSGYDSYHHIQDHFKEYHTVIRCQRCHELFKGEAAMLTKNEHQIRCEAQQPTQADDALVIDCDMKLRLKDKMKRFKRWSLESDYSEDRDMKIWISNCIGMLTGIAKPRAELNEDELQTVILDERELAKWYTCWITLFPNIPIPPHPFREHSISPSILNRQRVVTLFEAVGEAVTEQSNLPPDLQNVVLQSLRLCVSIGLNMLVLPNSVNHLDPNLMARITRLQRLGMQEMAHTPTQEAIAVPSLPVVATSTIQDTPVSATVENAGHAGFSLPPSQYNETQAYRAPSCHHCSDFGWIASPTYYWDGSSQGQGTLQPCICRSSSTGYTLQ